MIRQATGRLAWLLADRYCRTVLLTVGLAHLVLFLGAAFALRLRYLDVPLGLILTHAPLILALVLPWTLPFCAALASLLAHQRLVPVLIAGRLAGAGPTALLAPILVLGALASGVGLALTHVGAPLAAWSLDQGLGRAILSHPRLALEHHAPGLATLGVCRGNGIDDLRTVTIGNDGTMATLVRRMDVNLDGRRWILAGRQIQGLAMGDGIPGSWTADQVQVALPAPVSMKEELDALRFYTTPELFNLERQQLMLLRQGRTLQPAQTARVETWPLLVAVRTLAGILPLIVLGLSLGSRLGGMLAIGVVVPVVAMLQLLTERTVCGPWGWQVFVIALTIIAAAWQRARA